MDRVQGREGDERGRGKHFGRFGLVAMVVSSSFWGRRRTIINGVEKVLVAGTG